MKQAVRGTERKCRSEACGKWWFFGADTAMSTSVCPFCRTPYGKIELGLDVTRFKTPAVKTPKVQTEASSVPAPKRGEFGYRGR